MDIASLRLLVLPASAITAVGIGLESVGINVLKLVHLNGLRKGLSVVAGACGLLSLVFYLMDANDPVFAQFQIEGNMLNLVTALGCAVTALCVGANALGVNVLKIAHAAQARKVLELVAGFLGVYGLILYLR